MFKKWFGKKNVKKVNPTQFEVDDKALWEFESYLEDLEKSQEKKVWDLRGSLYRAFDQGWEMQSYVDGFYGEQPEGGTVYVHQWKYSIGKSYWNFETPKPGVSEAVRDKLKTAISIALKNYNLTSLKHDIVKAIWYKVYKIRKTFLQEYNANKAIVNLGVKGQQLFDLTALNDKDRATVKFCVDSAKEINGSNDYEFIYEKYGTLSSNDTLRDIMDELNGVDQIDEMAHSKDE